MAEPETIPESEGEPEAEPEVEPEAEGEPEIESGAKALTEPEPEWTVAFNTWGPAWHIHVYMFASLFMLIALLTIMSMCFYITNRRALKQGILTFTLQCLLLYFTLFRSLAMFINPYQTADNINKAVFAMIWSCALPGLTASFSVLLLVFLDTTKMTLGPPVFQKLSVLLLFTTCHFIIVVSSDSICLFSKSTCKPMLLFCQILFILYGALLAAGYCYTAICLHRKCVTGIINGKTSDDWSCFFF